MTAPDRIYAAPPHDDPEWKSGSGEWDISDGWAADGLTGYIKLSLYRELLAERNAAVEALINDRFKVWRMAQLRAAEVVELAATAEHEKLERYRSKGRESTGRIHGYTSGVLMKTAREIRRRLRKEKVPSNFSE
jgi:hypothetical protein